MNFDSKNLFISIVWIIITILEAYIIDWQRVSIDNLDYVSWMIIINLILQIICWRVAKRDYISFFFAFVLFYYLFHFGQVIITGLFPDYPLEYLNYVTAYMDTYNLGITIEVCLICINAFYIGGLIFRYKVRRKNLTQRKDVGKQLFWTLFPIKFCLDIFQIAVALYLGYGGVNIVMNRIPGVLANLANMWYATIPIYYLSLVQKGKRKEANNLVMWTIIYMCITMITGNRGHQTVAIISLMIVVILTNKTVGIKDLLKYGIYGICGLIFLDIVYAFRETSISEFFSNYSTFTETEEGSNIIIETIGTFGETIFTPFLVIEGRDRIFSPFFGETFIKSFVAIIPDPIGLFKNINNEAIFTKQLGVKNAIGGSFAGELYYNFGNLYPLFSFLIGSGFAVISDKVNKMIGLRQFTMITFSLAVCGLFIWWVRDAVGNLTRQIAWMWVLIYLFGGFKKLPTSQTLRR